MCNSPRSYAASLLCSDVFNSDSAKWRSMIGIGILPPLLILACLSLMPESPRWLVAAGRNADALHVLKRVSAPFVLKCFCGCGACFLWRVELVVEGCGRLFPWKWRHHASDCCCLRSHRRYRCRFFFFCVPRLVGRENEGRRFCPSDRPQENPRLMMMKCCGGKRGGDVLVVVCIAAEGAPSPQQVI